MSPIKQFEHQLTLCRATTCWWNFQGERQISIWVTGLGRNISEKQRKLKSLSFLWYTISKNNMNRELPDIQAGFRKGRGIRDQIANIHWIIKKQESSRKTLISALLTMPKPLTVWITINCGKFLEVGIPDHLTCLLRSLYAGQEATVRTGHGTTDWFQIEKGVQWDCILPSCLFNLYTEKHWGGWSTSWNQDC